MLRIKREAENETKTMTVPHLRPLKLLGLESVVRISGVDKINRTGRALSERSIIAICTIFYAGLPDRPCEKSPSPSKPSFTASRYISQDDDDAISEHSLVTGAFGKILVRRKTRC